MIALLKNTRITLLIWLSYIGRSRENNHIMKYKEVVCQKQRNHNVYCTFINISPRYVATINLAVASSVL